MKIVEYSDAEMLAIDLANQLAGELESVLFHEDTASFAVPGGNTPGPIFDALCAADLDWSRVRIIPTDERWVPSDHERSNGRMIAERLMTARAATATLLPLHVDAATPEEVLPEIEATLVPHVPIDVLLLGMGADMHTASLFPGTAGLEAALSPRAPIVSVLRPETQPEARVSLSARVLDGALAKHLVIQGAEKRAALERALSLPPEEAPVQAVLHGATVHWSE